MNETTLCHFKNFKVNYTNTINIKMAFTGVEFSKIAYSSDRDLLHKTLENTNFNILYINNIEDTNLIIANYALNSNFLVFSFSGTKDYSYKNIKTNWNLLLKKTETGRVHSGFTKLFAAFKKIVSPFVKNKNILWTGHSRGGVLAALCQAYYQRGVTYSFGCPRFANREWVKNNTLPHYRFTFANDPIQYLPPKILSYKHHGYGIELEENKIFNDLENINNNNFAINDLTYDWHLIKYSVVDWIRGRAPGLHHYKENYSDYFRKITE